MYTQGEALNLSGLVVTGTYSDGTTKTEYWYDISGYDADTLGQQTVTVTVGDKTATFTVTVKITAAFVVNGNLEDPINGIPENIVLSKGGTPASLTLEIIGDYESYEWLL
ncbi:MAG: bacterial Ig-like domain-containing protein, partial [Treponema sp.]|nr:bacterial Ig-like domain-containing protein [Treponema sp.]